MVNVFIALCGSTLATYISSLSFRGKVVVSDIANAALAGGVAIAITIAIATISGLMVGKIISLINVQENIYDDSAEFTDAG